MLHRGEFAPKVEQDAVGAHLQGIMEQHARVHDARHLAGLHLIRVVVPLRGAAAGHELDIRPRVARVLFLGGELQPRAGCHLGEPAAQVLLGEHPVADGDHLVPLDDIHRQGSCIADQEQKVAEPEPGNQKQQEERRGKGAYDDAIPQPAVELRQLSVDTDPIGRMDPKRKQHPGKAQLPGT